MNEEQYKELKNYLSSVLANQEALVRKVDALHSDVRTIINNQIISGQDQDNLIDSVKKLREKVSKL